MPKTYEPISTQTLGTATATVEFTSIPQTYTDLILVVVGGNTAGGEDIALTFNSDTGTNYSRTVLIGNGSTASSVRTSNAARIALSAAFTTTLDATNTITHIMNYSNTTTYKTVLHRGNNAAGAVYLLAGLWRSTSAITSLNANTTGSTWLAGTKFSLYGVKAFA